MCVAGWYIVQDKKKTATQKHGIDIDWQRTDMDRTWKHILSPRLYLLCILDGAHSAHNSLSDTIA